MGTVMVEMRGAYLTTPIWARVLDSALRAGSYAALSMMHVATMLRHDPTFGFVSAWNGIVAVGGAVVAGAMALAVVCRLVQVEYVALPLLIGLLGARLILGIAAIGIGSRTLLLLAACLALGARYLWIHVTVVRARMLRRLYRPTKTEE